MACSLQQRFKATLLATNVPFHSCLPIWQNLHQAQCLPDGVQVSSGISVCFMALLPGASLQVSHQQHLSGSGLKWMFDEGVHMKPNASCSVSREY